MWDTAGSEHFLFLCRAFKINELKTEVTNRLAMLEKRVECKCTLAFTRPAGLRFFWAAVRRAFSPQPTVS